jgi:hypothetical protein
LRHSYIIELKYAKSKDTDQRVKQLRQEGKAARNALLRDKSERLGQLVRWSVLNTLPPKKVK